MKPIPLSELRLYPRQHIRVSARLTGIKSRKRIGDKQYRSIRISDHQDDVTAIIWKGSELFNQVDLIDPQTFPLVDLTCTYMEINNTPFIKVDNLSLRLSAISVEEAVKLVPKLYVPACARPSLSRLLGLLDDLQNQFLRELLCQLFSQHEIIKQFVRARASWNHHHNYPGGLLVHSVESALLAKTIAVTMQKDRFTVEVSMVSALLHDLGKIITHDQSRATAVGASFHQVLSHEVVTVQLLTPILDDLDGHYPFEVMLFKALFQRFAYAGNKWQASVVVEDIVRRADALSVCAVMTSSIEDWKKCFNVKRPTEAINDD